ncbi:nucleoside triphosphate pyrophosphohydrolase family protein [soil metagenome]
MIKELELVEEFHTKFKQPILTSPSLIPDDRSSNRYCLMKDEVEEYKAGVEKGDLENIAKELADILYAVYGTILEHGLQNRMEAIFEEVHRSNMSKDFDEYKMVKGASYFKADIKKALGLI